MVKDVFHSEYLKRQGHEEDVVGRIASLNHVKSARQEDPPRVQEFPEERPTIFPEIAEGSVPFFRHRVPVDVNPFQHLILAVALAPRREHRHFVPTLIKRAHLLPHTAVKGHGEVLYDDQNFPFHECAIARATCRVRPARTTWLPVPSAGSESC